MSLLFDGLPSATFLLPSKGREPAIVLKINGGDQTGCKESLLGQWQSGPEGFTFLGGQENDVSTPSPCPKVPWLLGLTPTCLEKTQKKGVVPP